MSVQVIFEATRQISAGPNSLFAVGRNGKDGEKDKNCEQVVRNPVSGATKQRFAPVQK